MTSSTATSLQTINSCCFDLKCMEDFESALCCEVIGRCANFLIVRPVSSFKSANCSQCRVIRNNGEDVHVCSCPMRMEIYSNLDK